jgi:hypothetical protein
LRCSGRQLLLLLLLLMSLLLRLHVRLLLLPELLLHYLLLRHASPRFRLLNCLPWLRWLLWLIRRHRLSSPLLRCCQPLLLLPSCQLLLLLQLHSEGQISISISHVRQQPHQALIPSTNLMLKSRLLLLGCQRTTHST